MEIGIHTGNFQDFRDNINNRNALLEKAYQQIHTVGFDCADLNVLCNTSVPYYTSSLSEAMTAAAREREIAEAAGVRIHQVHGPWPTDDKTAELRREKISHIERAIRLTSVFGARYLVLHPDMPYGWDNDPEPSLPRQTNLEMLQALLPVAEECQVILCLENMPMKNLTLSRTEAMYAFVQQIGHPNLGMCLDTGHANVFGDDCGEMVRLIAPVLKVVHVHDNLGDRDAHLAPYQGTVNWDNFTSALRDIGFTGVFSLEADLDVRDMNDARHSDSARRMAGLARKLATQAAKV